MVIAQFSSCLCTPQGCRGRVAVFSDRAGHLDEANSARTASANSPPLEPPLVRRYAKTLTPEAAKLEECRRCIGPSNRDDNVRRRVSAFLQRWCCGK